ncbi:antibiotic biosynthesis monooxygenase family protein [Streptomyces sp. B1866]|uniref:antibiotic biosynthesis monooxygenase family protein n=1 Tax=Streptomyces sp. B1866 TaxID=3075431 RepID=UPI00289293CD|nr:antibiotic biosynthesis monooxygenase family protein [Streptomyces sp. B1866]MDT3397091.1 antibiotic biosynthesis monooxygenase family protein [Streptomyces sp. B1866]
MTQPAESAPAVRPEAADSPAGPIRILYFASVAPGDEARFLAAYDSIRHRVAQAPGHVSEQLCQAADDPTQWLITSEWSSQEDYAAWAARRDFFPELSDPITATIVERRHMRLVVHRSTG